MAFVSPPPSVESGDLSGTASLEELIQSVVWTGTFSTDGTTDLLLAAKFAMRAMSLTYVNGSGGIAASATDYWTATLTKITPGVVSNDIAAKSTQTTVGEAIAAARTPWTFDAVPFEATNKIMAANDILAVRWNKTGTPAANPNGRLYTIRYEPV